MGPSGAPRNDAFYTSPQGAHFRWAILCSEPLSPAPWLFETTCVTLSGVDVGGMNRRGMQVFSCRLQEASNGLRKHCLHAVLSMGCGIRGEEWAPKGRKP